MPIHDTLLLFSLLLTLALALSLPFELDYWWTVQSIAFGVVLFSLFVQAPSLPPLLRHVRK